MNDDFDYDVGTFNNRLMYVSKLVFSAMCEALIASISNKTECKTRPSLAFQGQVKAWKKPSKNPPAFEGRITISSPCRFNLIKLVTWWCFKVNRCEITSCKLQISTHKWCSNFWGDGPVMERFEEILSPFNAWRHCWIWHFWWHSLVLWKLQTHQLCTNYI